MNINPDNKPDQSKPVDAAEAMPDMDLQQQLSDIDSLLINETAPVQTGAGQSQGISVDTSAMCASLITVLFSVMAARRGDHWTLTETESEQLGQALAAVLDKYAPEFQGGPEATLILLALVIVGPKAMHDMQNRKKSEKKSDKAPAAPGQQSRQSRPEPEPIDPASDWVQDKS